MSVLAKVDSGFTKELSTSGYDEIRILVDGPYGGPINVTPYAGVTMMATGAGIAAQLPYMKELLEFQRSIRDTGGKQKISLIWQLDQECKFSSRSCIECKKTLSDHWICDVEVYFDMMFCLRMLKK